MKSSTFEPGVREENTEYKAAFPNYGKLNFFIKTQYIVTSVRFSPLEFESIPV